jgi:predicted RNase H-like HicB family nuclease
MSIYVAVIERDVDTGYFVGHVPNFHSAHSQAETLDELYDNLWEVIELLLEDEWSERRQINQKGLDVVLKNKRGDLC